MQSSPKAAAMGTSARSLQPLPAHPLPQMASVWPSQSSGWALARCATPLPTPPADVPPQPPSSGRVAVTSGAAGEGSAVVRQPDLRAKRWCPDNCCDNTPLLKLPLEEASECKKTTTEKEKKKNRNKKASPLVNPRAGGIKAPENIYIGLP